MELRKNKLNSCWTEIRVIGLWCGWFEWVKAGLGWDWAAMFAGGIRLLFSGIRIIMNKWRSILLWNM